MTDLRRKVVSPHSVAAAGLLALAVAAGALRVLAEVLDNAGG